MRIKSDLLQKKESIRAWAGGERGEGSQTKMPRTLSGSASRWKARWPRKCTASASSQVPRAPWSRSQDHTDADSRAPGRDEGREVGQGVFHSLKVGAVPAEEAESVFM